LIAEAARRMQQDNNQKVIKRPDIPELQTTVRFPDSWGPDKRMEEIENKMHDDLSQMLQTLKEGENVETMLKSKGWEKVYLPESNSVHAKMTGASDGLEYDIYPDGKVVTTSGIAGTQKVERESDEKLASYVAQMKVLHENGVSPKNDLELESGNSVNKTYTQTELDEKANVFAERLKSRNWKKEYLPENDIIVVRQKRVKDGLEYMINNDGTVLETGLRDKAVKIIEPNRESAKTFAKYKKKLDPNAPKTSIWMKGKEAVADVWKFFTVSAAMGVATAKGLWQGALTGAAVLATAILAKGAIAVIKNEKTVSDIIKNPLKTAGKSGKILAAAAGALVLTAHLIAGRLEANQKSAVIEHKVDVPHVD
jgi:hypothetical protein